MYELFKDDTCALLGGSELRVLRSAPEDVDKYTSMAVDDATVMYMKITVRGL